MAITLLSRPRVFKYSSPGSPSAQVYSYWNTSENRGSCLYSFNIATDEDRRSEIKIKIYEVGTNTLLSESFHRPYKLGTFYIDLASFIRPYLLSEFDGDGIVLNKKDVGGSIRVYISYQQIFPDQSLGDVFTDYSYPVFILRSALQLGNSTGANLINYVIFPDEDETKGKFLTKFDQPRKWAGYDRTISFIYDNYMRANELIAVQEDLNINKANQNQVSNVLDNQYFNSVNMLKIQDPETDNIRFSNVYLEVGEEVNTFYVESGYVQNGYQTIG